MNEPQIECFDCMAAAAGVHHGFVNGCVGCCARAAARSPHFDRVRKAGSLRGDYGYRSLLEQFKLTHEQVKDAAASDAMHKAVT